MILLPVKEDPTVTFSLWFKVGSQDDPAGKEGLAAFTAAMISDGSTTEDSYEVILEKLYPMATGYGERVDKEMTVISGRTHTDNLDEFYKLLTNAILKPAFKDEDFQRQKSLFLNAIEKDLRYSSDEELGKASLYDFVFAGTPYGHYAGGTVQSLNNITLDDIRSFYKSHYTYDKLIIGMGGAYPSKLIDQIQKDLAQLPAKGTESADKPQPAPINGYELLLVDKDCDATAISFGFPVDIHRGDKDFFALSLFNSWFGEHRNSSSHLYQVIRELRGMNYGDYSYIETFLNGSRLQMPQPNNARRQQLFEVWLRPVQHQHRHFALRAALREMKDVIDNGMSKNDFELTKKFLYKYALNYAPTTSDRLGYAIDGKFYGIDAYGDYIDLFRESIAALTLEDVNNAIKRNLQYQNIKFAIVTKDAAKFAKELADDIASPVTYSTPKPQQVLDEDKIIEKYPLKFTADKIKIIEVEDMFSK